jgi:hypothetical protein
MEDEHQDQQQTQRYAFYMTMIPTKWEMGHNEKMMERNADEFTMLILKVVNLTR